MVDASVAEETAPRGLVPIVALLTMLGPFSIDTYLPSFPEIESELGVGRGVMTQTMSIYLITFAFSTLLWGPLSDNFGRRPMVLLSLTLYTLASVGCVTADSFAALLLFRALQGLAASGGMVIGRAMIRDSFSGPRAQRAMAHTMMLFATAPAIAPILGGWLHETFGWRSVFVFLALHAGVLVVMITFLARETLAPEHRHRFHPLAALRMYGAALAHSRFMLLVFTFSAWFGGMFLYIAGSPSLIFDHLGLGTDSFAVQFVPMVAGVMAGSFIAGELAHRWPPNRIVRLALILALVAAALNFIQAEWLAPAVVTVIGPLVLYGLAVALAMPNLTLMVLDCFPRNRGMAAGVQGFLQMGSNALIAALLVPLVASSLLYFVFAQLALLLAVIVCWRLAGAAGTEEASP